MANSYGYSCKRTTINNTIYQVYGKWTIPSSSAGIYSETNTNNNIPPEMFFGFYTSTGVGYDIGILLTGNNHWKAFYGSTQGGWSDANLSVTLIPGETLYVNSWFEKPTANTCVVHLTLSRTSYSHNEVGNFSYSLQPNDQAIINSIGPGCRVNREIAIPANYGARNTYLNSGCYLNEGRFSEHTIMMVNGSYSVWTDSITLDVETLNPSPGAYDYLYDDTGKSVLEFRKDEKQKGENVRKCISANRGNNSVTGAFETVTIQY